MADFSMYGPRRKVAGGIESRTKRGAFGRTWWGKEFVAAMETIADAGRLSRGRTYARGSAVLSLEIRAGRIVGDVQGSQVDPFSAEVRLTPLDAFATEELLAEVRRAPGMLAEVASGTLPTALGPRLLPASAAELDFQCTCPDSGWPCKHAAALTYLAAEEIDVDASKILVLRGIDPDSLIPGADVMEARVPADDHFGDRTDLPPLPAPVFVSALDDLDPALLRQAFRAAGVGESDVATAMAQIKALYRRLE